MARKIVIIGAGEFQNPLIVKAKNMGYETHVFAWKCGDIGEKTADFFYPISIVEKEKILTYCRKIKPEAVVSIGSDLAVLTVNYLLRELKLNGNKKESDLITTNKYRMRETLKKCGIWTPRFWKVEEGEFFEWNVKGTIPLIVKPTDRSGSRGVFKVNKTEELNEAIRRAQKLSFEKTAIVEEFIEGEEYSCECISFHGKHHLLAVTKKYTTGAPYYIETGHIQPAGLSDEVMKKIEQDIFFALDALKITEGASHCEIKIKGDKIGIIEIGARMGGDCIGSHLVFYSTGYDFLEMVIDTARGESPMLKKKQAGSPVLIRFILDENDKEILKKAENDIKVEVIEKSVKDDDTEIVTDSSERKGYFILKSKDDVNLRAYCPQKCQWEDKKKRGRCQNE